MRLYLIVFALAATGCTTAAPFPTGTFTVTLTPTQQTCAYQVTSGSISMSIEEDDTGNYTVAIAGIINPVTTVDSRTLTFSAPDSVSTGSCDYDVVDNYTLVAAGQSFTGTVQAVDTDPTATCADCEITYSLTAALTGP